MRTILVALDDSDHARRVALFVNEFFRHMDVHILGLSVSRVPASWLLPPVP